MTWKVTFPSGQVVRFDDVPHDLFHKAAAKYGSNWLRLYYGPAENVDMLHDLLGRIAEHVKCDPPAYPTSMRDALALCDLVERMDDTEANDLPVEYVNGFPQTADDPETS